MLKTKMFMKGQTMKLPKGLTRRQMDLLIKITPGPIGEGKTIIDAAKELEITKQAAHERLRNFKKNFPNEYQTWWDLRELSRKQREGLKNIKYVGDFPESGEDVLLALEEESYSHHPSQWAKDFGLIREIF